MPDEQKKPGLWSRLGRGLQRALPAIEKGSARLAYAGGNRGPLQLLLAQEADERKREREARLDALAAETHDVQQRINERQASIPLPETPEQQSARALTDLKARLELEQGFKPPVPFAATTEPTGRPLYLRGATGESERQTTTIPRPELGPPSAIGQLIKPPSQIKAPLFEPLKEDVSRTPYEDLISPDPARREAAERAVNIMKPPKPPSGIPGSGRPLFEKSTGKYLGDYFAEGGKFVPVPTNIAGVPAEGVATKPLTDTGVRMQSDAGTALVLLEDIESASRGEHAAEAVPFAVGARSLRAAKDDVMDILRRMRTGAAINAAEEGFYRDQIPGVLDSEEDRLYKTGILRQLFTALSTGQPKPDLAKLRKAGIGKDTPAPTGFKYTATDPKTGARVGSNDGVNWEPLRKP